MSWDEDRGIGAGDGASCRVCPTRAERKVLVTLRGKPLATVTAVPEGADWESLAIATHPKFLEIMERSRAAHRLQGGISPAEMRRHFGIKGKRKPPRRKRRPSR